MLGRLLALVVIVVAIVVGLQYWNRQSAVGASAGSTAHELGNDARALGEQAKDTLVEVGEDLRDAKVSGAVKTALSLNRNLSPYALKVSTTDRVVRLRGTVDNPKVRAEVEALVAQVPDVLRVVNEIGIGPSGPLTAKDSPEARAMAAQLALDGNASLQGLELQVRIEDDGRLVLNGRVNTAAEKDLAGVLAREAAGTPVVNGVAVRPGAVASAQ